MSLPDLTTALGSNLRSLHLAIADRLGQTFGAEQVRAHSAEVTPSTVVQYSQGKWAVWVVLGSADGVKDTGPGELRMKVRWGVFIVAHALHEVPDELEPERTRSVPAVEVAETMANIVVRLAHQTKWGIVEANGVPGDTISARNLGVGLKTTKDFVEQEDIGLWVVWGSNEIDMGAGILPGDIQLPPLEAMLGDIHGICEPDVDSKIPFNLEFSGLRRLWQWVTGKLFGPPAWAHEMAVVINTATRDLAHG